SASPRKALWAPPFVPGKFGDAVRPATKTSPVVGSIARPLATSSPLPPRNVVSSKPVRSSIRRATNASSPPPIRRCAPGAGPGTRGARGGPPHVRPPRRSDRESERDLLAASAEGGCLEQRIDHDCSRRVVVAQPKAILFARDHVRRGNGVARPGDLLIRD